jgi:hypothetical protein
MQGIFISYRRQDAAGYAGRLHERLASHFGRERVFMDVEGIEPGVDFVEELERAVASCEVLIVIIGNGWLATDKAGKRRLDDPRDFVHIETAAALARHIRVVPVLVDGAVMPREEELPANLKKLARRQAVELSNKHWDATTAELIRTLERILDGDTASPATYLRGARRTWVIGGVLALVAAALGVYLTQPWWEPEKPVQQAAPAKVAPPADAVAKQTPEKTASTAEKPPAVPEKAPILEKPPAAPDKAAPTVEKPAASEKPAPSVEKPPAAKEKPSPPTAKAPSSPEKAAPATAKPPPSPEKAAPAAQKPSALPEKAAPSEPSQAAKPVEPPPPPVAIAPAIPPPAATPPTPAAALPASLPRIGDTWEYRWRSKWPTVQPRTYTHRVTAVSAREVAQTISVDTNPDVAAARQALTPDTRFVEWRGQGFYLLEFNPFLDAFGGLQNSPATLKVPAMPPETPFQAGWYSQARIKGSESVTVPAGTFKTLKLEIDSNRQPTESLGNRSREPTRAILTLWYAPDVKRIVKMVRLVMSDEGMHLDEDTYELVRYKVQ